MIRLLRAYGLSNLRPINEAADPDIEDDDDALPSPKPLEDIVRENPGFALSRLAGVFGLNYERIKTNMELYEDFLELRAKQAAAKQAKRSRGTTSEGGKSDKRHKAEDMPASQSPLSVKSVTIGGIELPVSHQSSSITWPETPDYVTWGRESNSPPRRRLQDAQDTLSAGGSSPRSQRAKEKEADRKSQPKGSTVPLSDLSPQAGSRNPIVVRQKS